MRRCLLTALWLARIAHGQLFVANREGGCIGEYTLSGNFCKAQLSKNVSPVQAPATLTEKVAGPPNGAGHFGFDGGWSLWHRLPSNCPCA